MTQDDLDVKIKRKIEKEQKLIEERKGKQKVCIRCHVEKDWLKDYYAKPKTICKECVKIKNKTYSKSRYQPKKPETIQKRKQEGKEHKAPVKYNKFIYLSKEKQDEICKLFEDGLSLRQIEEKTGFCYNTLRNWKRRGLIQVDDTKTNRFRREYKLGKQEKSISDEESQDLENEDPPSKDVVKENLC